jgi:hypothetical protein
MIITSITPVGWDTQGSIITDYLGRVFVRPDGRELLQVTYPTLYALIGNRFNTGSTTANYFRIPDFRGAFIRGANLGSTTDPDPSIRTLPGTPTADSGPGTVQTKCLSSHTHGNPTTFANFWYPGGATAFRPPNCPAFALTNASTSGLLNTTAASGLGTVDTSSDLRPLTFIVDYLMRIS